MDNKVKRSSVVDVAGHSTVTTESPPQMNFTWNNNSSSEFQVNIVIQETFEYRCNFVDIYLLRDLKVVISFM